MGWFGEDLFSAIARQFNRDKERKAKELASAQADPVIAERISSYRRRFPHLTPGIVLPAAQAGLSPNDPAIDRLAAQAAKRKAQKGKGWFSIGDRPLALNPLDIIARSWDEIEDVTKSVVRGGLTVALSGGEALQGFARQQFREIEDRGPIAGLTRPFREGVFPIRETTAGVAIERIRTGEGGAGIGQGYLPRGPATEEQARRARETAFIEYADHPLWHMPGDKREVEQHAGTLGRLAIKDIVQPGSRPYWLLSGIIDAGFAIVADPLAVTAKATTAFRQGRKLFTADEAGRTGTQTAEALTSGEKVVKLFRGGQVLPEDDATRLARQELIEDYTKELSNPRLSEADRLVTQTRIESLQQQGRWWTDDPEYAKTFGADLWEISVPESVAKEAMGAARLRNSKFSKVKKGTEYLLPEEFRGVGHKAYIGMVDGVRPTNHPPTTQNWLTLSAPGRKFTQWVADTNDPYTIWRTLGGEKGNITPDLAVRMADTVDTNSALEVLSPELGVGLRSKPITSRVQPVGGYAGEVKASLYQNRIFNQMPHSAVRVDDPEEVATQLVRLLRTAELPDDQISAYFNKAARATTPTERVETLMEAEIGLARHIATQELKGPLASRDINFTRLRGAFLTNNKAMEEVTRWQIANKADVRGVSIDGNTLPIGSVHLEREYLDQIYQLPDIRAMRRMMSQYGRLLNNRFLDVPISALDHIQNVWRGASILRPALLLRTVGEEQAWMAGSGYDSVFTHPFSFVGWATGRKGTIPDLFDAADEASSFSKAMSKSEEWRNRIIGSRKRVVPFTDPEFTKAWSVDIWRLREDEVARRLAAGEDLSTTKVWLSSPEAAPYRTLNDIPDDAISGYVENLSNRLKGTTYGDQSLLSAIATGQYNSRALFAVDDQGKAVLDQGFRNHLKKLVDSDISPDHTVGDLPQPRLHPREYYNTFTDWAFDSLLTRPSNYLSRSTTFKQDYWRKIEEGIIHADPATQARSIELAQQANMPKSYLASLRARAKTAAGDLTEEELDLWAKAQALQTTKRLLTDLSDKNQLLDAMRLSIVFGEAWKQSLTTWASVIYRNPVVVPRMSMVIRGGQNSGFFYTDPQDGEEKFAYPGAEFITGKITQALTGVNIPTPVQARLESLTLFGDNPLIPSFGPVAQIAAGRLLPDTPDNDAIRKVFLPYESPGSPLPGWLDKIWTAAFADPTKNVMYGNMVWDVARYLKSTGEYDIDTLAGQQAIEDKARKTARILLAFRGAAQAVLPAAPSYQDIAKDQDGHTTLAFTLTRRYQELLQEDREKRTNEAAGRFIAEFGMDNLLYMQSASQGGETFSKTGLEWIRTNPDIVDRYPDVYGLLAPNDGGFDIKAYMALFERGERKLLDPKEALKLANHRAAKMIVRNAQDMLPDPSKRSTAQRMWLNDLKERLKDRFPGFDPEYQGTDIPAQIEQLSIAVADPLLSRLPITPAIQTYLTARSQVAAAANAAGIIGWQTAKKTRAQREWLRRVASGLMAEFPQFKQVYNDLFDIELTDDANE